MKILILTGLLLSAVSNAFAGETIGPVEWDYAYVDLNQACQRYYSLYPPSVKCIEDRLYRVQFKISYSYHGLSKTVFLSYIPGPQTRLDENGTIIPPDYTIKDRS